MNKVSTNDVGQNYEMVAGHIDAESQQPDSWKNSGKHSISWNKLSWEVEIKKLGTVNGTKKILNDVSGLVESGNVRLIPENIVRMSYVSLY